MIDLLNWFAASGWRTAALFAFTWLVLVGLTDIVRAWRK